MCFCLDLHLGFEFVGFDLGSYLFWLRLSLFVYFVVRSRYLRLCLSIYQVTRQLKVSGLGVFIGFLKAVL